jgi:L-ascorbate metabolism protein UlaG (beta-lactamase superfamily)
MTKIASTLGGKAQGLRRERVLASPRFRDGRFRNTAPVGPGIKGNPLPVLGEYFFVKGQRTPPGPLPLADPRPAWASAIDTGLRVTWLGHSSVLLELDGFRVLTDPVFGERASPVSFAGPKRFHPVPAPVADLPELDAVLVSHDHYDHLCRETILELCKREVPFVTSLGVGAHLEAWGVPAARITELDWWDEHVFPGGSLSITAAPSQHFSGRAPHDRNQTLWSSWVVRTEQRRIFFSGDTGLTDEFRDIGARLGPFELAMFEIGAWNVAWGDIHLGPHNALRAHALLGSGAFLPVHWGTFNLALHDWDEPAETLFGLAEQEKVRILTPMLGAPFEPAKVDAPKPWWRGVSRK